jgi:UDP-glucose 4-epimerase
MKKVVVFGGSGFLGSYVSDELTRRGYDVTIADIKESKYLKHNQRFEYADIMNSKNIRKLIKGTNIVYNFVSLANIDDAINDPVGALNLNVAGHLNLLELCARNKKIERFVYASSAYALSGEGSFYGITKQTAEKLTEEYFNRYGLKYTIIRYGSLYGERASPNNYIYNLLERAIQTGYLEYKGGDSDIREYIHSADAARLSVDVLENIKYENEHIILTGIEKFKRIELLNMIDEIMQGELKIKKISENNMGHYKITPYVYHPTIAKKLVANPFIDIGQGIVECIQTIYKLKSDIK